MLYLIYKRGFPNNTIEYETEDETEAQDIVKILTEEGQAVWYEKASHEYMNHRIQENVWSMLN